MFDKKMMKIVNVFLLAIMNMYVSVY